MLTERIKVLKNRLPGLMSKLLVAKAWTDEARRAALEARQAGSRGSRYGLTGGWDKWGANRRQQILAVAEKDVNQLSSRGMNINHAMDRVSSRYGIPADNLDQHMQNVAGLSDSRLHDYKVNDTGLTAAAYDRKFK